MTNIEQITKGFQRVTKVPNYFVLPNVTVLGERDTSDDNATNATVFNSLTTLPNGFTMPKLTKFYNSFIFLITLSKRFKLPE